MSLDPYGGDEPIPNTFYRPRESERGIYTEKKIGDEATVDYPWLAEPVREALQFALELEGLSVRVHNRGDGLLAEFASASKRICARKLEPTNPVAPIRMLFTALFQARPEFHRRH